MAIASLPYFGMRDHLVVFDWLKFVFFVVGRSSAISYKIYIPKLGVLYCIGNESMETVLG